MYLHECFRLNPLKNLCEIFVMNNSGLYNYHPIDKATYTNNISAILGDTITNTVTGGGHTGVLDQSHNQVSKTLAGNNLMRNIFDETLQHNPMINIKTQVTSGEVMLDDRMQEKIRQRNTDKNLMYNQLIRQTEEHLGKEDFLMNTMQKYPRHKKKAIEENRPKLIKTTYEDPEPYFTEDQLEILRKKHDLASNKIFKPNSKNNQKDGQAYADYQLDIVQQSDKSKHDYDILVNKLSKEEDIEKKAMKKQDMVEMKERRENIETRLRAMLSDAAIVGTGLYKKEEGFVVSSDLVLTLQTHFDSCYLRFSVFLKGSQKSDYFTTKKNYSEIYKDNVSSVFWGEKCIIKDIEADEHCYLIIELLNNVKLNNMHSTELVGWTLIQLFTEQANLFQNKWCIPFYKPPTQFNAQPCEMTSNIVLVEGCKVFIRICVPNNERLNYHIKKKDKLPDDYKSSWIYQLAKREPKFYAEWLEQHRAKAFKAKKLADRLEDDLETIRIYLENEKDWLKKTSDDYVIKLSDELERLRALYKAKMEGDGQKDDLSNLRKNIEDAEGGKATGDDEVTDELDNYEGVKQGIKVTFNKVLDIATYKGVKIHQEVFQEAGRIFDEFGNPCYYNTSRVEDHIPADLKTAKKIPEPIDVIFGDIHYIVKHQQGLLEFYNHKRELYLLFTVYEVDGPPFLKTKKKWPFSYLLKEKRVQVGWKVFKANRDDFILKQGRFKEYLWRLPTQNPPPNEEKMGFAKKHHVALDFTLEIFNYTNDNRGDFAYRMMKRKKKEVKEKADDVDLRPFIPNDNLPWTDTPFEKGAGVDFYIDSARYQPNSCTITKIMVRIVDNSITDLIAPQSKTADLNSSVYHPSFDFRTELRFPFFNPTSMIIIMLLTVDVRDDDSKSSIVGYSFFPLFTNPATYEQPEDLNEKNFVLRNGHYQIPIFSQEYFQKKPFLYKDQKHLDKLPCATLLVRCKLAPRQGFKILGIDEVPQKDWEKTGVWPLPPPYHKKMYYNSECKVNDSEFDLFEILRSRKDTIVAEKAVELAYKLDKPLDPEMDAQDIEEFLYEMIDNHLKPTSRIDIIDLKFLAVYNIKAGFKFCVDGYHNLPKKGVFCCLYCINPPGTLYLDDPDALRVHVNTAFDWDSPKRSPKFSEGYVDIKDETFDNSKHMVIDIREIIFKRKKETVIKEFGWTILPLFTYDGFVNSGIYQLPIMRGGVQKKILKELAGSKNPWATFYEMTKTLEEYTKKPLQVLNGECSVIVRQLDGQREGHFQIPFDHKRMNRGYLPKKKLFEYTYNEVVAEVLEKEPILKDLIPTNTGVSEFNKRITHAFVDVFKMQHYKESKL